MHDAVSGDIATRPKEMELGGEGLAEEDQYLLEINLEELESSTGEEQAYWLVALRITGGKKVATNTTRETKQWQPELLRY